jgi:AMIN domain
MHSREQTALSGINLVEGSEWPATTGFVTRNRGANQKPTIMGLFLQLLATVFAVVALVITIGSYTSSRQHPEFIWLFISCSAIFYLVCYNALSMEHAFRWWIDRRYPSLQGFSIVVAVMLATSPIGALYFVRLDVAHPLSSVRAVNRAVTAPASASPGSKGEAANAGNSPERPAELAHQIVVLRDVQYESGPSATTVTIGVNENVEYDINRLTNPDRIYLDFHESKLDGSLLKQRFQVSDAVLRAIRIAEHKGNVSRVTLETNRFCDYLLITDAKSHQLQIELLNPATSRLNLQPSPGMARLASNIDSPHR